MTDYGKYRDWASKGAIVDAKYAHGMGLAARGVVVAFTDEPTVSIRQADGTVVTWLARMCERTTGEENLTQFLREMRPARREHSVQPPIRPGTARRLGLRQPRPWMPHRGRMHIIEMKPGPSVCVNCGQPPFRECPKAPPCHCPACEPAQPFRLLPSERAHLDGCAYPSGVGFCSCP